MTNRVNDTHNLLNDLKERVGNLEQRDTGDVSSAPEVVATFYYSLNDKNNGNTHRSVLLRSAYSSDELESLKDTLNNPHINLEGVKDNLSSFFNNFSYSGVDAIPLTDENYEYLPDNSQIVWEGVRTPATADGTLLPTFKEDGNLLLPDGSIHISQIYPDGGSDSVTNIPYLVFMVNGTKGAYSGHGELVMMIEYDNDGTVFGDGSRKKLRRLRLVKGDYTQLLDEKPDDFLMDAQMSDIPENGVLDKIFIFRNNPLNLVNRTLTRKPGTLGSILVVGQGATFNDFGQIAGLEGIESASQSVTHKMENVVLEGLGSDIRDINALTLVNVDNNSTFDNITVNNSQDDGIEIFGGSVNMSNITIVDAVDDYFDSDHGHSGTISNLDLKQQQSGKGKSLIECGNSKGTTTTKFVNLTYDGGNNVSNYQNNGSDKNLNIKSGSSVEVNGITLTQPQDNLP